MANWHHNVFNVEGEKVELEMFKLQAMGTNNFCDEKELAVFSFKSLIPIPEEIINDPDKRRNWVYENWGVYGVADPILDCEEENSLTYLFSTPNAAPIVFTRNLGKLWPNLKFYDSFVEPMNLPVALMIEVQGENATPVMLTCSRKGYAFVREKAESGDPQFQYDLGCYYANGEEVPADLDEALKWWKLAAAKGEDSAKNILGYFQGDRIYNPTQPVRIPPRFPLFVKGRDY